MSQPTPLDTDQPDAPLVSEPVSAHLRSQLDKLREHFTFGPFARLTDQEAKALTIEASAGMMAARAAVVLLNGKHPGEQERLWEDFFNTWGTVETFARKAYPEPDFTSLARDGFCAMFTHLQKQSGVERLEDMVRVTLPRPRKGRSRR